MIDSEDFYSPIPSELDKNRLCDMDIGDRVDAENGVWTVFRYEKDYFLLFNMGHDQSFHEFKTAEEIIKFLNS